MDAGSSPRMWGTPDVPVRPDDGVRFIPTHVGNAPPPGPTCRTAPVHPHACGERCKYSDVAGHLSRFIPTHVGNAPASPRATRTSTVHPHACGERYCEVFCGAAWVGSSPRMWGTQSRWCALNANPRFIPTHVGNAVMGKGMQAQVTVHPHACGERGGGGDNEARLGGSSPRMWGTHMVSNRALHYHRFIPTHVGNARSAGPRRSGASVHPHACGEREKAIAMLKDIFGSSPRMWGTHFF